MWYGSGKNILNFDLDPDQGAIQGVFFPTFLIIVIIYDIFAVFPENNKRIFMKKIRHIKGTDVYECVKFGAACLNLRGLLGLGDGMRSTEWHCSFCIILFPGLFCLSPVMF